MCKELLQVRNLFLRSVLFRGTCKIRKKNTITYLGVGNLPYFRKNSKSFKTSSKIAIYDFFGKTEVFTDYIGGSEENDTCFTYAQIG